MNVVGILKDVENRLVVELGLAMMGHSSVICSALSDGMAAITNSTDIVIADAFIDGLGPSGVGFLVSSVLSESHPRLVLVARPGTKESLGNLPPDRIVGVLEMPLIAMKLRKVIRFLEYASRKCPGTVTHLKCEGFVDGKDIKGMAYPCHSWDYGRCARYKSRCGVNVQTWIASDLSMEWQTYAMLEPDGMLMHG